MENFDYDLRSIQEARDLARRGEAAAKKMAGYTSGQIDMILQNMVRTAEAHGACLARMAVEETGFGKVLDKTYKNHAASTLLYNDIKDMKTIGIISEDTVKGTMDVAEPVGLIMGIVPSTNPTSTTIYKSMIDTNLFYGFGVNTNMRNKFYAIFAIVPACLKIYFKNNIFIFGNSL